MRLQQPHKGTVACPDTLGPIAIEDDGVRLNSRPLMPLGSMTLVLNAGLSVAVGTRMLRSGLNAEQKILTGDLMDDLALPESKEKRTQ
jgi:hypothetical protein